MAILNSKSDVRGSGIVVCWILLVCAACCLLSYGLSFLFAAPTIETITTNSRAPANVVAAGSPPDSDENDHLLRNVKFRGAKRH